MKPALERAVLGVAVAASAAYVALALAIALVRMRYPFELEWMEGGMVEHVRRVLDGRPLYARPSLEFVSFLYPPAYYYAGAAVSWLTGAGFLPLRLLSIVSSIAVLGLLFETARRETASAAAGVLAAGLFAATYGRTGGWIDLARLDAFFLATLFGGVFLWRYGRSLGSAVASGALLAVAVLTKQSGVVAIAPLLALAVWSDRRRGLATAGALAGSLAFACLVLERGSGGWFSYYCMELPARHPRIPGGGLAFWARDLLGSVPFALAAAAGAAAHRLRRLHERAGLFLPVFAAGLLAASWSVRSVYGAEVNNVLPAFAGIALLAASAAAAPSRSTALAARTLVLAQLVLLAYLPARLVPSASDLEAGHALVERLRALPGDVFIPHHGYLARMAGKSPHAHTLAMDNVFLDDPGPARAELEAEVRGALAERRFGAAIVESDRRYRAWIEAGYAMREPLFDRPDVFWPVSGGRLRPEALALPRSPDGAAGHLVE